MDLETPSRRAAGDTPPASATSMNVSRSSRSSMVFHFLQQKLPKEEATVTEYGTPRWHRWDAQAGVAPQERRLRCAQPSRLPLNGMQSSGLDSAAAARRVIELAEEVPAPSLAPVGSDAQEILRLVREKSDAEQDALRLQ